MWLYAGHVSQIPATGDFFTVSVLGESIIINRGEDGRINALYNVCRQRIDERVGPTRGAAHGRPGR